MLFDMIFEGIQGVAQGIGKTAMLGTKMGRNRYRKRMEESGGFWSKQWDDTVRDYRNLENSYSLGKNPNTLDRGISKGMAGIGLGLNRGGQVLGSVMTAGVGGALAIGAKAGWKAGKFLGKASWRIGRTAGREAPHEIYQNGKIAYKAGKGIARGGFAVGKGLVKAGQKPSTGIPLMAGGGLLGISVFDIQNDAGALNHALGDVFGKDAVGGMLDFKNTVNKDGKTWINPDTGELMNGDYWFDQKSGEYMQARGPDGKPLTMDSSQVFTNQNVYSPNNKRMNNAGADGGLALALHDGR